MKRRPEGYWNPYWQCTDPCCYHRLAEATEYEALIDALLEMDRRLKEKDETLET